MLTWPHAGFHVHTAVWVPADDRAFATRLARYCARNPVALERLTYDRAAKAVTYRSDKSDGPTAGTETADPIEFLARVLVHIPDKGHVMTRYYGWHANRARGMRRQDEPVALEAAPAILPAPRLAPTEAARAGARHAPHARPPTPRLPPEDAPPDAPRPRGAVRRTRLSPRRASWVPAGFGHPR